MTSAAQARFLGLDGLQADLLPGPCIASTPCSGRDRGCIASSTQSTSGKESVGSLLEDHPFILALVGLLISRSAKEEGFVHLYHPTNLSAEIVWPLLFCPSSLSEGHAIVPTSDTLLARHQLGITDIGVVTSCALYRSPANCHLRILALSRAAKRLLHGEHRYMIFRAARGSKHLQPLVESSNITDLL